MQSAAGGAAGRPPAPARLPRRPGAASAEERARRVAAQQQAAALEAAALDEALLHTVQFLVGCVERLGASPRRRWGGFSLLADPILYEFAPPTDLFD